LNERRVGHAETKLKKINIRKNTENTVKKEISSVFGRQEIFLPNVLKKQPSIYLYLIPGTYFMTIYCFEPI